MTKPLSLAELLARIRAVLRRTGKSDERDILEVPPIKVDLRRHSAFKGNVELRLTDTEFQILVLLLKRAGEVIAREEFLKQVWGDECRFST